MTFCRCQSFGCYFHDIRNQNALLFSYKNKVSARAQGRNNSLVFEIVHNNFNELNDNILYKQRTAV